MALNEVPMNGKDIIVFVSEVADKLPEAETYYIAATGRGSLLAFYDRNLGTTTDIDFFMLYVDVTPSPLTNAIQEVADKYGLGPDWMNDDVMTAPWNTQKEDDLTVEELRTFFLSNQEIEFKNSNGCITLVVTPITELGIWASKILSARPKDATALRAIFENEGIEYVSDLVQRFEEANSSFVDYEKYPIMLSNAADLLGDVFYDDEYYDDESW